MPAACAQKAGRTRAGDASGAAELHEPRPPMSSDDDGIWSQRQNAGCQPRNRARPVSSGRVQDRITYAQHARKSFRRPVDVIQWGLTIGRRFRLDNVADDTGRCGLSPLP